MLKNNEIHAQFVRAQFNDNEGKTRKLGGGGGDNPNALTARNSDIVKAIYIKVGHLLVLLQNGNFTLFSFSPLLSKI